MAFKFSDKRRVSVAVAISIALFFGELAAAYKTGSLALMADAFHVLNDVLSYGVTLAAIHFTKKPKHRQDFSYGWQRARVLGAFFNGSLLLAIAFSILLQSIERFTSLKTVEDPILVLIMGSVGLGLNIVSAAFLHEHHGHHHHNLDQQQQQRRQRQRQRQLHYHGGPDSEAECPFDPGAHAGHRHASHTIQPPGRDLGLLGAVLHALSDCLSNVGVIIAALIVWLTSWPARFYADPAAGMAISALILAPTGVNLADIKHDMEQIPGVLSVHELHVWRLDQAKAVASAHIVVSDPDVASFVATAATIGECLHAYGIHSATLQPELAAEADAAAVSDVVAVGNDDGGGGPAGCQIVCGKGVCGHLMCCGGPVKV
ncbi:cation efflux protein [Parathielavia hyrcaniae]|uniref:Cation efflux protein n=1 Tax=Parathielavia hyrcaniae TaxID=113614 RepID=A0AAN6Q4T5_9PEZI|nr:cation efflux protein [Parathielavia hyrcaniae]